MQTQSRGPGNDPFRLFADRLHSESEKSTPADIVERLLPSLAAVIARSMSLEKSQVIRALDIFPGTKSKRASRNSREQLDPQAFFADVIACSLRGENDRWSELYQRAFTKKTRQLQGEFFTPAWLAELLWRRARRHVVPTHGACTPCIMDPGCGCGALLLPHIKELIADHVPIEQITHSFCGFDINPLSLFFCRANILILLLQSLSQSERIKWASSWASLAPGHSPVPVYLYDTIRAEPVSDLFPPPDPVLLRNRYDVVIGNPPWVNWDRLSEEYRTSTLPLWSRYGLFSLSGADVRLGGAKKELASLMLLRTADLFLKQDGILAMVVPWSLFQTQKSGEGFRRLRLGKEGTLRLLEVDDLSSCSVFPGVNSQAGTIILKKGGETRWPVACRQWNERSGVRDCRNMYIHPVDPARMESPWIVTATARTEPIRHDSYQAQLGCNSGGANGVYWVEVIRAGSRLNLVRNMSDRGKRNVETLEIELESELIFPLLRWRDVDTFSASPSGFVLVTQNIVSRRGIEPDVMAEQYPRTLDYLRRFEAVLRQRAMFRKLQANAPFWSMYNVNSKTMAPYKVVWRRMDDRLRAAAVLPDPETGRPLVPQETLCLVAVDSVQEADYLAAVLNSDPIQDRVRSLCTPHTRGFGSPGILAHLGVPRFDLTRNEHREFAKYGKQQRRIARE